METNLSIPLHEEDRNTLPSFGVLLLLFFLTSGLINYVYFADIYLVSEGRASDFELKGFLLANLGLKAILFPFKFVGMTLLFRMGAFLFKIEDLKFLSVLKVVILAELMKYLPEITKIVWFSFIASEDLVGYDLTSFNDYFSLNGLLGITKENAIHSLLDYFSLVELCYILGVAKLLQMEIGSNFSNHLRWSGVTYFSFVFILGLVITLISL